MIWKIFHRYICYSLFRLEHISQTIYPIQVCVLYCVFVSVCLGSSLYNLAFGMYDQKSRGRERNKPKKEEKKRTVKGQYFPPDVTSTDRNIKPQDKVKESSQQICVGCARTKNI